MTKLTRPDAPALLELESLMTLTPDELGGGNDALRHRREDLERSVEISSIDLRYQHCRLSHGPNEQRLLSSILEQGIHDPLLGVIRDNAPVLLDGFKRLRCARKLKINQVPFRSLADDEATAIIALMRLSNAKTLTLLEQACLIDELRRVHKISVAEIARRLERGVTWVSARQGILGELTPLIKEKIMSGAFPLSAYMYNLRTVRRLSSVQPREIEEFVSATAGKGLSVRDLDILAKGYFKGGEEFRCHVQQGDVRWCLDALRQVSDSGAAAASNDDERKVLIDLEIVQRRLRRLPGMLATPKIQSPAFLAEVHLLSGGILRLIQPFTKAIKDFYDRTRPQESHRGHAQERHGDPRDHAVSRD
jgi:hypothetical protein